MHFNSDVVTQMNHRVHIAYKVVI